jgi:hypothetical protein
MKGQSQTFLLKAQKNLGFVESPSILSPQGVPSDEDSIHNFEFPVHSYEDSEIDVQDREAASQGANDKEDQEANKRCKEKKHKKKMKKKQKEGEEGKTKQRF